MVSVTNRVKSVDEWEYLINNDPVYFDSIVAIMGSLGLFQDKSEPGYQVLQLYKEGEDLDKYHWEKYIWNFGKGPFVGVKLVKNQFADAIRVNIPDFTEQELSEILKHHDTDEVMGAFGYNQKRE